MDQSFSLSQHSLKYKRLKFCSKFALILVPLIEFRVIEVLHKIAKCKIQINEIFHTKDIKTSFWLCSQTLNLNCCSKLIVMAEFRYLKIQYTRSDQLFKLFAYYRKAFILTIQFLINHSSLFVSRPQIYYDGNIVLHLIMLLVRIHQLSIQ